MKLERIDPLYIFHPKSLIDVKEDTKLRFESQEYAEFLERMSESQIYKILDFAYFSMSLAYFHNKNTLLSVLCLSARNVKEKGIL